jgi:hypothetical protein
MYQDAASNVLVAICRHSWQVVAQHLETEFLTGVFPHRSRLYVMGVLASRGTAMGVAGGRSQRGTQEALWGPGIGQGHLWAVQEVCVVATGYSPKAPRPPTPQQAGPPPGPPHRTESSVRCWHWAWTEPRPCEAASLAWPPHIVTAACAPSFGHTRQAHMRRRAQRGSTKG